MTDHWECTRCGWLTTAEAQPDECTLCGNTRFRQSDITEGPEQRGNVVVWVCSSCGTRHEGAEPQACQGCGRENTLQRQRTDGEERGDERQRGLLGRLSGLFGR
ncbi:MAG: hypothetical protein ABEJ08_05110 [Halobacteriaceae archaeon]